jgi:hypothetical protein
MNMRFPYQLSTHERSMQRTEAQKANAGRMVSMDPLYASKNPNAILNATQDIMLLRRNMDMNLSDN